MTKNTLTTSADRALVILNEQLGSSFVWHNPLILEERLNSEIENADQDVQTVAVAGGVGVADSESLHSVVGQMRKSGFPVVFTSHAVANSNDEKGFLGLPLDNGNWVCLTFSHDYSKDCENIESLTLCSDVDAMLGRQAAHVQWLINEHLDPIIEMSRDIGKMLKITNLTREQSEQVVSGLRQALISKTQTLVEDATNEARAHLDPVAPAGGLEMA